MGRVQLERLHEYPLALLGGEDPLDGPFLLPPTDVGLPSEFGLLVSLRGKDGGAMPSPSELQWHREVPAGVRGGPVHLFLRRGPAAVYLGRCSAVRRGQVARDGYKVLFELVEPLDTALWKEFVTKASAPPPPPPPPEEAIVALAPTSTTAERLAAMRVFAERWYGCDPAARPLDLACHPPAPLGVLHGLIQGHEVCAQNTLVSPAELVPADGKVTFYVENQGVWEWATESEGDDPPVYVREGESYAPWKKESDSLSGFLIQMLMLEAIFGAPFGACNDWLEPEALARLMKRLPPISIPPWAASGERFLARSGVIGFAGPFEGTFSVWVGAKDRIRLEPFERLVADWPEKWF